MSRRWLVVLARRVAGAGLFAAGLFGAGPFGAALFAAIVAQAPTAHAREPESLTGQWSASGLTEVWSFPQWPAACGPKPPPESSPGGPATVNEEAGELVFSGPGRTYRTTQCWEQYPGLRRVAHSRSASAWSNTCKSGQNDPRQANIRTSVALQGETLLKFRETGSYEFHIEAAKCVAQVTRTRTYTRSGVPKANESSTPEGLPGPQEVPAASPGPAAPTASAGASPAPAELSNPRPAELSQPRSQPSREDQTPHSLSEPRVRRDCKSVGVPREIKTPGPIPWLQPGATQRLSPVIVDEAGCLVAKGPFTYSVEPDTEAVRVGMHNGVVRVAPEAAEGTYSVVIRSGELREVIEVPVVTKAGLAAFLQGPFEDPVTGETPGQTPAPAEVLGTFAGQAVDHATPRKWWFVGLAGLVTLGLGAFGLRLLRAGSRPTVPPAAGDVGRHKAEATTLVSATAPTPAREASRSNPPPKPISRPVNPIPEPPQSSTPDIVRRCIQCGARYTDGSSFCGIDGSKLVDQNENGQNETAL